MFCPISILGGKIECFEFTDGILADRGVCPFGCDQKPRGSRNAIRRVVGNVLPHPKCGRSISTLGRALDSDHRPGGIRRPSA